MFCIKLFTLVVYIILYLVVYGDGIRCYVCRSDKMEGCDDKLIKSHVQDCPTRPDYPGPGYCRKIVQQLYFKNEDKETVIRECAYEAAEHCYKSRWLRDSYQETCECNTDECNRAADKVHLPTVLAAAFVLLLLLT